MIVHSPRRTWSVLPAANIVLCSLSCVLGYTHTSLALSRLQTIHRLRGGGAAGVCGAAMSDKATKAPVPSKRILATDDPCIVQMQKMMRGKEGLLSLAQGIVHWKPPQSVGEAARRAMEEDDTNAYCADDGLASLREALQHKIRSENGLMNSEIMVTSGSNQAYANLVLSLLDESDAAIVFRPYYFNHMMALQMVGANVEIAATHEDLQPDLTALQQRLSSTTDPHVKLVTVCQPGNPTGVMMPAATLEQIAAMCAAAGCWLVVDNAYEYFAYPSAGHPAHSCVEGPNIINLFSFSKSYGMMGWRVGYLAYPREGMLGSQLFKTQDTIPICPPVMSQKAALGALEAGAPWVRDKVADLASNKQLLITTITDCLGPDSVLGGSGAIYLMVRLPKTRDGELVDDVALVEWLGGSYKVCVIPGTACGLRGHIRVCYSNLTPERCQDAAARLRAGLEALIRGEGP